jgi:hypothetical protein
MSLPPDLQDLLDGLTRRYYRDQLPMLHSMGACVVGYLRIFGKHKEAEALQATINSIKLPK